MKNSNQERVKAIEGKDSRIERVPSTFYKDGSTAAMQIE
jgi:hypothetical protein